MGGDPAFLFYPGDWLGGTMGMSLEEKGAYLELLILQFNRGHMTSHMIGQVIGQTFAQIQHKFKQDVAGLWFNERLELEQNKRKLFVNSRNNNMLGVNQYSNKKEKNPGHTTSRMEDRDINGIRDSKEDTNADGSKVNSARPSKKMSEVIWPFDSDAFKDAWNLWTEYRKEKNKPAYKPIGLQGALSELANLSGGNEPAALKIIYQSIHKNWEGFFPLKNDNKNGIAREAVESAVRATFG